MRVLGEPDEAEAVEDTAWLFVPARPVINPGEEVFAELRRLSDGRLALLAYTSLPELVGCCGEHQSWVSFPASWLERLREKCRFDAVALNLPLPPEARIQPEFHDWPGKPEEWDD
jgi:hypothetical protein